MVHYFNCWVQIVAESWNNLLWSPYEIGQTIMYFVL